MDLLSSELGDVLSTKTSTISHARNKQMITQNKTKQNKKHANLFELDHPVELLT